MSYTELANENIKNCRAALSQTHALTQTQAASRKKCSAQLDLSHLESIMSLMAVARRHFSQFTTIYQRPAGAEQLELF